MTNEKQSSGDSKSGAANSTPANAKSGKQSAVISNDFSQNRDTTCAPQCKSSASAGSEAQFMAHYSGMQYYSCESKYKDPAGAEYSNSTTMMFLPFNKP